MVVISTPTAHTFSHAQFVSVLVPVSYSQFVLQENSHLVRLTPRTTRGSSVHVTARHLTRHTLFERHAFTWRIQFFFGSILAKLIRCSAIWKSVFSFQHVLHRRRLAAVADRKSRVLRGATTSLGTVRAQRGGGSHDGAFRLFAIKVREGNVPSGIQSAFKHPILELSALINRSARKLMREATATADLGFVFSFDSLFTAMELSASVGSVLWDETTKSARNVSLIRQPCSVAIPDVSDNSVFTALALPR